MFERLECRSQLGFLGTADTVGRCVGVYIGLELQGVMVQCLPWPPSFAVMFDTIAGRPEIAPDGSLAPISPARAWVLILPFLTILGHGAYYYFRYM